MENVTASACEVHNLDGLGFYVSSVWATAIPHGVDVGKRPCRVIMEQITDRNRKLQIEQERDRNQLKFGFVEETPQE